MPQRPRISPVSCEMMSEELMTAAYQLAVSPVRQKNMYIEIVRLFPNLDFHARRSVEMAVHYLRYPDNEYFVGDEVQFIHMGQLEAGTVIEAEWEEERAPWQRLLVRSQETNYYISNFDCI